MQFFGYTPRPQKVKYLKRGILKRFGASGTAQIVRDITTQPLAFRASESLGFRFDQLAKRETVRERTPMQHISLGICQSKALGYG
jgi:hypothetical protein